ncbi:MAG: hypothetical protein CM15mP129_05730 [Chloroflexota bacterium]|nr:MAG: hypothetical protein CM15mP129_05730 [Chloroflexota bacterium]
MLLVTKSNLLDNLNLNTYHNKDFEKTKYGFQCFKLLTFLIQTETDLIVSYGDIIIEKG